MEFDAQWISDHPDDFGMVIHELIHVIQAYPAAGDKPGWLVEGIAAWCAHSTRHCATARTPKHCGHK